MTNYAVAASSLPATVSGMCVTRTVYTPAPLDLVDSTPSRPFELAGENMG